MERINDFSQLKKGDLCSFSANSYGVIKNFVDVFTQIDDDSDVRFEGGYFEEDTIKALYRLEKADNRIIVGDVWAGKNDNNEVEIIGLDTDNVCYLQKSGYVDSWSRANFKNHYHKKTNAPTEVEEAIKVLEDAGRIKNGKIIE